MKQRWIFRIFGITQALTLALLCVSCTGFFEIEGKEEVTPYAYNPNKPSTTYINFYNGENRLISVDVFSNFDRDSGSMIASVPAGGRSNDRKWISNTDMNVPACEFYLTYYLPAGVTGKGIPYIPRKFGADLISVPVPKDGTTIIPIPDLAKVINAANAMDEVLFENEVYLVIKNEYPSAIQLNRGGVTVESVNKETLIVYGSAAVYKMPVNAAGSLYKIRTGITERDMPAATFKPGYVYEVTYTAGSIAELRGENLYTMNYVVNNN